MGLGVREPWLPRRFGGVSQHRGRRPVPAL